MVEVVTPDQQQDAGVFVPLPVLDGIRAALNSAYYHQHTYDVMEAYRQLAANPTPSAMTQALFRALSNVHEYMAQAVPEDSEAADEEPDE